MEVVEQFTSTIRLTWKTIYCFAISQNAKYYTGFLLFTKCKVLYRVAAFIFSILNLNSFTIIYFMFNSNEITVKCLDKRDELYWKKWRISFKNHFYCITTRIPIAISICLVWNIKMYHTFNWIQSVYLKKKNCLKKKIGYKNAVFFFTTKLLFILILSNWKLIRLSQLWFII